MSDVSREQFNEEMLRLVTMWRYTARLGRVKTIYGLRPWWKALCHWVSEGNEALTIKTLKAFPRALKFSIRTRSLEGTLWV